MKLTALFLALLASNAAPHDYMADLVSAEAKYAEASGRAQRESPAGILPADQERQMLAVARSMVGDTIGANEMMRGHREGPASEKSFGDTRDILVNYRAENALGAILREAKSRQIVILNEGHHVPRHRAFALRLAIELRKLGFEYIAMETLSPKLDTPALVRRGYARIEDGYYSREPLFGDLIRRSLAVGYKVVAYEQQYDPNGNYADAIARIDGREEAQAQNLMDRLLKDRPNARLFIYLGYGHLVKEPVAIGDGKMMLWMAGRLRAKSGVDPLCIDETQVGEADRTGAYDDLIDALFPKPGGDPVALASRSISGKYWPGIEGTDMQIIHPSARLIDGRPDWMSMNGYRKPRAIPAELLPKRGRRLIQAFVEGEAADAVPMDQVIVTAGEKPTVLLLPKGRYRFAFQDEVVTSSLPSPSAAQSGSRVH